MREFRAWSKKLSVMVYDDEDYSYGLWDGYYNSIVGTVNHILDDYGNDLYDYVWLQWTGLYDRNKKKIFEGDLLKGHDNFIYRVWSVAGGFAINVHVDKFKNDIKLDYPVPLQPLADEQTVSYVESQCEVIGNVFENPELLKL